MCLAIFLVAVDGTVLSLATPSIVEDLQPTATQVLWIGDIYSFVLAGLLVTMGNLGDRVGRKRMLLIGGTAFALISIPAAFAGSAEMLIAMRALLGVAGATLMPSTLALMRSTFSDARERSFAVGVWSAMGAAGAAAGPLVGGILLQNYWWGSVFLITVPLVAIDLLLGWWVLPKRSGEDATSVDHVGGVLSVVAVATLVIALQSIAGYHWLRVAILLAVSAVSFWLFLRQERRAQRPLVDLDDAKAVTFWVAAVAGTVTFGSLMGMLFIGQQFTQNVMGFSALEAATFQLPVSVMLILMSLPAARLVGRFGGRVTLAAGLVVTLLAFAWILVFWRPGASDFHILFAYALVGTGVGLAVTPASKALMASLPASRAGMGSAFTDLTRDFGGSVMNAVMGTALAVAYGAAITTDLKGLSPQQSAALGESAAQQMVSSFEGAAQVAAHYQPPISGQIVSAAAKAFSEGKELAVGIALLFTLAAVVLVLVKYPRKVPEFDFYAGIEHQNSVEAASSGQH